MILENLDNLDDNATLIVTRHGNSFKVGITSEDSVHLPSLNGARRSATGSKRGQASGKSLQSGLSRKSGKSSENSNARFRTYEGQIGVKKWVQQHRGYSGMREMDKSGDKHGHLNPITTSPLTSFLVLPCSES